MLKKKTDKSCALILGGYVNGYSIIKELYEEGIREIALFDTERSLAKYSNKVKYHAIIDKKPDKLLSELKKLNNQYDYIVIFPTDDLQLLNLHMIYDEILNFCYVPFNRDKLIDQINKYFQYQACEKIIIPYPKTLNIKLATDLEIIDTLNFPLLIKPSSRKNFNLDVFRTLYIEVYEDYIKAKTNLIEKLKEGFEFVISEYIPGDDTNLYIYTCFRSEDSKILNEWNGKKLTQYPDAFGVFSSASNESTDTVLIQGRALVDSLDAKGIVEAEFKYDERDGQFKLMETTLRSSMPHRIGNISGVKLYETQYKYATKQEVIQYTQDKSQRIHFVLMSHEILNLVVRKGYWKHFKHNIWGGDKRDWAIFEWRDIKPFYYSLLLFLKIFIKAVLVRLSFK
jgi:D-aspartate ligase